MVIATNSTATTTTASTTATTTTALQDQPTTTTLQDPTTTMQVHFSLSNTVNPLPHGVLASFYLTAGGLPRPPEEDNISREKTILMTSLQVL
jgi:hypothetical protein